MNIEELRIYCVEKKEVTESFPFDTSTLVFKVADKMFALIGLDRMPHAVNLKCNPDKAIGLRESYQAVTSAYHMSKKHWNTITLEDDMDAKEIKQWIDHSYNLVVNGLTKKKQRELGFIK
ncbi:putative DNA-binding protein (MmcQ/YjbR family) [Wenyingzhuangia heitensis]|uniref:DNA-binding protein (MmcQ/YjbR family) n=1 Tax=Wenyingzhuangia heitensis TaxID=1487859 RepID=A0ABX0UGQ3_9FLAO|nr:MmcQ/YjbR family DNA-binding protein [Wenyingzhuangia heitensis]NIJ46571.1 putative DNA-binding protein (MmcQ/YjbR family) [Wenyingzhuangia heitensis]